GVWGDWEDQRLEGSARLVGVPRHVNGHEDLLVHVVDLLWIEESPAEVRQHLGSEVVQQRAVRVAITLLGPCHPARATRPTAATRRPISRGHAMLVRASALAGGAKRHAVQKTHECDERGAAGQVSS